MRSETLLKHVLAGYWVGFAVLTSRMALLPGPWSYKLYTPYPWRSVAAICALLAVFDVLLYFLIVLQEHSKPWGRLSSAFLFSCFVLVVSLFWFTFGLGSEPDPYR